MQTIKYDANGNGIAQKVPSVNELVYLNDGFNDMGHQSTVGEYFEGADMSDDCSDCSDSDGEFAGGARRKNRNKTVMRELKKFVRGIKHNKKDILKIIKKHGGSMPIGGDVVGGEIVGGNYPGQGMGIQYSYGDPRFNDAAEGGSMAGGAWYDDLWSGIKSVGSWVWDNKDTIIPIVKEAVKLAAGRDIPHEDALHESVMGGVHSFLRTLPFVKRMPTAELHKYLQEISDDLAGGPITEDDDKYLKGLNNIYNKRLDLNKKYGPEKTKSRDSERSQWLTRYMNKAKKLPGFFHKDGQGEYHQYHKSNLDDKVQPRINQKGRPYLFYKEGKPVKVAKQSVKAPKKSVKKSVKAPKEPKEPKKSKKSKLALRVEELEKVIKESIKKSSAAKKPRNPRKSPKVAAVEILNTTSPAVLEVLNSLPPAEQEQVIQAVAEHVDSVPAGVIISDVPFNISDVIGEVSRAVEEEETPNYGSGRRFGGARFGGSYPGEAVNRELMRYAPTRSLQTRYTPDSSQISRVRFG